ncbi:MAG: helix-turn-helix domain-containing protein [Chloroflexi bacterium]|nr:helix-turn-helix domain-containing protein [Chloroflexota bacterium]
MARVAATVPGFVSVGRAGEVLHLAPRSVRDLIYAGRLPSLRVGRLHYIKAADLEVERRRRLGLPLPRPLRRQVAPRPRRPRAAHAQLPTDIPEAQAQLPMLADGPVRRGSQLRYERAAQRAELARRWARRHSPDGPRVPANVRAVTSPATCEACGREVRRGRMVEFTPEMDQPPARLCVTCGRRVLLDWADRRRQESTAARRLSQSLGQPEAPAGDAATQASTPDLFAA